MQPGWALLSLVPGLVAPREGTLSVFLFFDNSFYLLMAVLSLRCFSVLLFSCSKQGRLLRCCARTSRCCGFPCCGAQALGVWA